MHTLNCVSTVYTKTVKNNVRLSATNNRNETVFIKNKHFIQIKTTNTIHVKLQTPAFWLKALTQHQFVRPPLKLFKNRH